MIRISFKYNGNNDPIAFKCSGHAGYAAKGKDIVCAAVSVLTLNTVNSIEEFTDDDFLLDYNEDNGFMFFRFNDDTVPSEEALLLLKSLELGIKGIAGENKGFIKLTEWEV